LDKDGKPVPDPNAQGTNKNLRITIEVEKSKKGNEGADPDSEARADQQAQRELEDYYIPFYPAAASLKAHAPNVRTSAEHFDVATGFEAFMGDMASLLRASSLNSESAKEMMETMRTRQQTRVGEDVLHGRIKDFLVRSNNIGGYSENYIEVIGAYFNSAPYMLSSVQYSPLFDRLSKFLGDGKRSQLKDLPSEYVNNPISEQELSFLKKNWDYMNDPVNDFQWLRTINFTYALGFNYSTGVLNLFGLPTIIYPSLALFGTGPVSNASKKDVKGRTLELQYDPVLDFEKIYRPVYGDKTSVMVQGLIQYENHLQQSLIDDSFTRDRIISPELSDSGRTPDALRRVKDKFIMTSGGPIHFAERWTRLSAMTSYLDQMLNADGTVNSDAVQSYLTSQKNNAMVQTILKNRNLTDINDPQTAYAIAAQLVRETHGVYDKTGRGLVQRGLAGSVFFPFMTYPLTVLEFLGNMALNSGPQGRVAFATAMGMFFMFAGMSGIPGWETWKEAYELWERFGFTGRGRYGARDIDADERIWHTLTEELGLPENFARAIVGGILAVEPVNMDFHRRIAIPYYFENLATMLANPGDVWSAARLTGVPGRALLDLQQGHFEVLAPVFAQNLLKATSWPEHGMRTMNENIYRNPEDVTIQEIMYKYIGIQAMSATRSARDFRAATQNNQAILNPALERLRNDVKRDALEEYRHQMRGNRERAEAIRDRIETRITQFVYDMYDRGQVVSQAQIDGIRETALNHISNFEDVGEYALERRGSQIQPQYDYTWESWDD
jgi:hypothetical protein